MFVQGLYKVLVICNEKVDLIVLQCEDKEYLNLDVKPYENESQNQFIEDNCNEREQSTNWG
jgi:hypothetical protein